jgi:tetratricopeptide (TPR) repeat protein
MPTIAELFESGVRYHQSGDLQEAERLYRQILQEEPSLADAHSYLGVLLQAVGRGQEALACFEQVVLLNPDQANAHNNLGNAFRCQGRLEEAVACLRQALRLNPQHAYAHNNLGAALLDQGHRALAIECYRQALRLDPAFANAHYNLGSALAAEGQPAEAVECFRQALRFNPGLVDAHNNLGNLLKDQGHIAEAIECYREALRINPHDIKAHNNLGVALRDHGNLAEALECFRQALTIDPREAEVHNNLGIAFMWLGQLEESLEQFELALRIHPDHKRALLNRSLQRLLRGDWERAWPDYEQRWVQADVTPRSFQQARWDGSRLDGKAILVYAEQGLGDTIQFLRYLPLVRQLGITVCFECQPALTNLLAGIAGVDQIVAAGAPLPHFDVQAPLLSLPGIFGTTVSTIPAPVPYLRADSERREWWRKELEPLGGFKIGIAWQGNPEVKGDCYRSFPLTCFEALARVEGARLVSLQKGPGTVQLSAQTFPILDLSDRLDREAAFIDTAAVMMNLDLVVTVDSALAHVAGALGVPVWVPLSLAPDWRWLLERTDSPWYPTMRLFRQDRLGDWESVFAEMATALMVPGSDRALLRPA